MAISMFTRWTQACLLVRAISVRPLSHGEVFEEVKRRRLMDMDEFEFMCFKFDCLPALRANYDAASQRSAVVQ